MTYRAKSIILYQNSAKIFLALMLTISTRPFSQKISVQNPNVCDNNCNGIHEIMMHKIQGGWPMTGTGGRERCMFTGWVSLVPDVWLTEFLEPYLLHSLPCDCLVVSCAFVHLVFDLPTVRLGMCVHAWVMGLCTNFLSWSSEGYTVWHILTCSSFPMEKNRMRVSRISASQNLEYAKRPYP